MIPRKDYQNSIDLIKSKDLIPEKYKSDIIVDDFRGIPEEETLQGLFNFYQGNVERHYKFGIEPGVVIFTTDITINAFAANWKDHFVIGINKGTIFFLINTFRNKSQLLDLVGLEKINQVDSKSDIPINELMYQLCGHYTFYHELGHLIQKSDGLKDRLNENTSTTLEFDITQHVLEHDADRFSAICLGTHLYQYIVNWCPNATDDEAELIIGGVLGSISVYLLNFSSAIKVFYLKEGSHPHPIVRIISILYVVVDYIDFLSGKKKKFILKRGAIINHTLTVTEILAESILGKNAMYDFLNKYQENKDSIIAYIEELNLEGEKIKHSAFNRRNDMTSK